MSEIVNDMIEDMLDSMWVAKNRKRIYSEPTYSFDEVLEDLGITRESLQNTVQQ